MCLDSILCFVCMCYVSFPRPHFMNFVVVVVLSETGSHVVQAGNKVNIYSQGQP